MDTTSIKKKTKLFPHFGLIDNLSPLHVKVLKPICHLTNFETAISPTSAHDSLPDLCVFYAPLVTMSIPQEQDTWRSECE